MPPKLSTLDVRKNLITKLLENRTPEKPKGDLSKTLDILKKAPDEEIDALLDHIFANFRSCTHDLFLESIVQECTSIIPRMVHKGIDVNLEFGYGKNGDSHTYLIFALLNHALASFKVLLEIPNIEVDQRALNESTALLVATEGLNLTEIVELLIQHGADVNAEARGKVTPLRIALFKRNNPLATYLIKHGADVNRIGHKNSTALHITCQNKNVPMALALVAKPETNINIIADPGQTALILASQAGLDEVVSALCDRSELDYNHANDMGITALMIACQNGHTQVVMKLLEKSDIKINHLIKNIKLKISAFVLACINGHTAIAKRLIEDDRLDVNQEVTKNISLLAMNAHAGNIKIVNALLKRTDISVRRKDGVSRRVLLTALELAASNGHYAIIRTLFEFNNEHQLHDFSRKELVNLQKLIDEHGDGEEEIDILAEANGHVKGEGSASEVAQHPVITAPVPDEEDFTSTMEKYLGPKTWPVNAAFSFNFSPNPEHPSRVFPFGMGGTTAYGVILLDKEELGAAAKHHGLNTEAMQQGKQYKKIVPLTQKGKTIKGFKKICYGGDNPGDMRIVGIELNKLLNQTEASAPPLFVFAALKTHKELKYLDNPEQTLFNQIHKVFAPLTAPSPPARASPQARPI